jgi:hypothetical protein
MAGASATQQARPAEARAFPRLPIITRLRRRRVSARAAAKAKPIPEN